MSLESKESFVASRVSWPRIKVIRLAVAWGLCGIRRGSMTMVGVPSPEVLGRIWEAKKQHKEVGYVDS